MRLSVFDYEEEWIDKYVIEVDKVYVQKIGNVRFVFSKEFIVNWCGDIHERIRSNYELVVGKKVYAWSIDLEENELIKALIVDGLGDEIARRMVNTIEEKMNNIGDEWWKGCGVQDICKEKGVQEILRKMGI